MAENRCAICKRLLDNPDDMPASADCGGDCRACMARFGDPDEIRNMRGDLAHAMNATDRAPNLGDPAVAALVAQAEAAGWSVEFKEWCEDAETPGLLGAYAGVCVHARKAIKVRTYDVTTAQVIAVLEHELRHAAGAQHAGDDPDLGLRCGGTGTGILGWSSGG